MRQLFVPVASRKAAKNAAPWAAKIIEVCGGYMCFESRGNLVISGCGCKQDTNLEDLTMIGLDKVDSLLPDLIALRDSYLLGDDINKVVLLSHIIVWLKYLIKNESLFGQSRAMLRELKAMHAEYCKGCPGGCPTLEIIEKAEGVN